MIRIFRTGAHAKRTPLSYPALAPAFEGEITFVDSPSRADLYLFAHVLDIEEAPRELVMDWRKRQPPVVLLSEEPFWDTIWSRQPLDRERVVETAFGLLPVIQLNHVTSRIFRFACLPYYLLTNHRFANAYTARFHRNAGITPAEWRARFAARGIDCAFMFERRPEPYHGVHWPEGDITGLCHWRTEVALACHAGEIRHYGQSWEGDRPTRFELADWHLDKLVRLDDRVRMLAAFENTHQPDYITEKLFDAFACGALPLYHASPNHRIHDLGLPGEAWLNLFGLAPAAAAQVIDTLVLTDGTFEAYALAQRHLADLVSKPGIWRRERQRVRRAVLEELAAVLDQHLPYPDSPVMPGAVVKRESLC